MKHLIALSVIAIAFTTAVPSALAQSSPPPLPQLTQQQADDVAQQLDVYRRATDARVARGEITADEAARLVSWREWQLAQQAAGLAPSPPALVGQRAPVYNDVPPDYYESRPRDYYAVTPPPVYVPYYRPAPSYYWAPRPYYWGPSVCAGGFGRHFGGRLCF